MYCQRSVQTVNNIKCSVLFTALKHQFTSQHTLADTSQTITVHCMQRRIYFIQLKNNMKCCVIPLHQLFFFLLLVKVHNVCFPFEAVN